MPRRGLNVVLLAQVGRCTKAVSVRKVRASLIFVRVMAGRGLYAWPLEERLVTFSALRWALLDHVCFVSAAWRFVRGLVSAELGRPA